MLDFTNVEEREATMPGVNIFRMSGIVHFREEFPTFVVYACFQKLSSLSSETFLSLERSLFLAGKLFSGGIHEINVILTIYIKALQVVQFCSILDCGNMS